ncbi:MAG TPA: NAD(P)H-hydrate dehydratase [Candidatus Limnocylindria bacterium]
MADAATLTQRWVAAHLPDRPPISHKGTFGRVLVVAGSLEYAGAAILTGLGAARAGAGLVCLATPESVGLRLLGLVPELTSLLLPEEAVGLVAPSGWRQLTAATGEYDAVVVGPGLGRHAATLRRVAHLLGEVRRPVVIDADGLTALAARDRWWRTVTAPAILSPHPGEFARLTRGADVPDADDDRGREQAASQAARLWEHVVILKGANTVVAAPDGHVLRSAVATPALATAGSGDVLAGAIGAMLAAGLSPIDAAGVGVAIHAAAGLLAEQRIGTAGVLASDIAGLLPEATTVLRGGAASS